MRNKKTIFVFMLAFIILLTSCSNQNITDQKDASGNTPKKVIQDYYEVIEDTKAAKEFYSKHYSDSISDKEESSYQVKLVKLAHCEQVPNDKLRESDKENYKTNLKDYYAVSYVQTSDEIIILGDAEKGRPEQQEKRQYAYTLVMETKDSDWQIYDMGQPPFYVPQ